MQVRVKENPEEFGREDNHNGDPYGESSPETVMQYLKGK